MRQILKIFNKKVFCANILYMKPKKHLGQNFLTSKKAVFEIIKAGDIQKDDFILEIGGGKGFLTEDLLKTTAKILVVEKDKELFLFLFRT